MLYIVLFLAALSVPSTEHLLFHGNIICNQLNTTAGHVCGQSNPDLEEPSSLPFLRYMECAVGDRISIPEHARVPCSYGVLQSDELPAKPLAYRFLSMRQDCVEIWPDFMPHVPLKKSIGIVYMTGPLHRPHGYIHFGCRTFPDVPHSTSRKDGEFFTIHENRFYSASGVNPRPAFNGGRFPRNSIHIFSGADGSGSSTRSSSGFFQRFAGVIEGPPKKDHADAREKNRKPCGLHHPNGRIRHALLGCQITPVWFALFSAVGLAGLYLGARGLIAIEDGRFTRGVLGLLAGTLLFGIAAGVGAGFLLADPIPAY